MLSRHAETEGDELPPGSTLCGGQYVIDGYLSSGGFGVTYHAGDSLGRRVVIKECFPSAMCFRNEHTVSPRSRSNAGEFEAILSLFEKEARALAALQHPYIVGVHQYFRENGTAYMAMDYIQGETLLDIIENDPKRLDPDTVKQLLLQVLQAVRYIHERDILHRDISPDNILIDADNLPVLIDFGAARNGATRVSRVLSKVLTVKDGYSPQEFYLAGSGQDHSSDLYALAATFYHVLAKAPPPSSHTRMAAAARDMADPLEPLGRMLGYDEHFISAINSCLSIFPKQRLQSAAAWQDRIDRERRIQAQMAMAERDKDLDRKIRELVAESQAWAAAQLKAKEVEPPDVPEPAPVAQAAPQPEPATQAEPEPAPEAPAEVEPAEAVPALEEAAAPEHSSEETDHEPAPEPDEAMPKREDLGRLALWRRRQLKPAMAASDQPRETQ